MNRNQIITNNRGETLGCVQASDKEEVFFQNAVFRPILKLHNELFIEVYKNYLSKHKSNFWELNDEHKKAFIASSIQKDIKFRNALKGIMIGWFTVPEYLLYTKNSSNLNKRMMNLLIERYQSQIHLI